MKIFDKILETYSQDQLEKTFQHSTCISDVFKISEYIAPRAIGMSHKTIHYEFLELTERLDHAIMNDTAKDDGTFYKIGKMLSSIHNHHSNNLLHGDFVLHNIFFNKSQDLCIIDSHPPEVIGYDENFLYGDGYIEMYLFILNLSSSYGVKSSLKNLRLLQKFIISFRSGYGKVNNLKSFLLSIKRFYKVRVKSGFSIFNTIIHVSVGVFFVISSNE